MLFGNAKLASRNVSQKQVFMLMVVALYVAFLTLGQLLQGGHGSGNITAASDGFQALNPQIPASKTLNLELAAENDDDADKEYADGSAFNTTDKSQDDSHSTEENNGVNLMEEEDGSTNSREDEPHPIGAGFDGATHMFHVTSNGTLVEGVVHLKLRPGEYPFQRAPTWLPDDDTHGRTFKYQNGSCVWCPRLRHRKSDCRFGTFHSGSYKDDHSRNKKYDNQAMFRVRSGPPVNLGRYKKDFRSTYLRCSMTDGEIPHNVEGVLRVEDMSNLVFYVNPAKNPALHKDSSVVCLKPIYGSGVSVHGMAQFLAHYLGNLNFTRVVLYEHGLVRGLTATDLKRDRRIAKWGDRFTVIDQRDSLQRLYGAIGSDISQFSGKQGQLVSIGDCILRAKVDGYEWALIVDRDEILAPGPMIAKSGKMETWVELVRRKETEMSTVPVYNQLLAIIFKAHIPVETAICNQCDALNSTELMNLIHKSDRELTADGFGKSAIRLSPFSRYPLTNAIGIHSTAGRGALGNSKVNIALYTAVVDMSEYHMRHYPCLNKISTKCPGLHLAFAPGFDWAVP